MSKGTAGCLIFNPWVGAQNIWPTAIAMPQNLRVYSANNGGAESDETYNVEISLEIEQPNCPASLRHAARGGAAIATAVTELSFPMEQRVVYIDAIGIPHDIVQRNSTGIATMYLECIGCLNTPLIAFQDANGNLQVANLTSSGLRAPDTYEIGWDIAVNIFSPAVNVTFPRPATIATAHAPSISSNNTTNLNFGYNWTQKKANDIDLQARLKRCEELLRNYGASVDYQVSGNHDNDEEMQTSPTGPTSPASELVQGTLLVSKPGVTKFIDNNLWTALLVELRDSREILQQTYSREEEDFDTNADSDDGGSGLLLSSGFKPPPLAALHPQPMQIIRLWQIFVENVNPFSKIVHTPTLQVQILDASGKLENLPKNLEALLFSIYMCAVVSLSDEECVDMMSEPKESLIARYSAAAEQSLVRVGFLQSSDIVVLQALVLFLIAVRSRHNPHAFWILCGVAVRLAQRLGIHRDGELLSQKLSVFDCEMRRRLWWQIMILDNRSAGPAGVGWSMLGKTWDSKVPGNFNDGDLNPDMRELPMEHTGPTEMIFCQMIYEFCKYFQQSVAKFDWQKKVSFSPSDTDKWLDGLEKQIRNKFLKYYDPSIPLHLLSETVAKSIIANKRLSAHHPRKNSDKTEQEREMIFENSLTVMGYDCLFHTAKSMRRYGWHVRGHFQYDVFVSLLSELKNRPLGVQVDRAWQLIQELYINHPELLADRASEIRVAVGRLTLQVWDTRELALRQTGQFMGIPEFISDLRSRNLETFRLKAKYESSGGRAATLGVTTNTAIGHDNSLTVQMDSGFNTGWQLDDNQLSNETNIVDWEYWNTLFTECDLQSGENSSQFFG
ncbi:hypothetical protein G7Y89_g1826 [Cudoniella acicularis]|uniref:Xylanolytic transcriptional activator regulatory domain-containing protein n=1 Tax=Cudoniella acicularis TaxID=354080 RepID=A0A8H4W967_9HELO|nr:hypothetical protein G7Y89_g1826 [Cudoniella acicularis]